MAALPTSSEGDEPSGRNAVASVEKRPMTASISAWFRPDTNAWSTFEGPSSSNAGFCVAQDVKMVANPTTKVK